MPIWGWVCVGLAVLAITFVVFAIINQGVERRRYEREGTEVMGWIVSADPVLSTPIGQNKPVRVLVSLEDGTPEPDFALAQLALRVAELKRREPKKGSETAIADIVCSETDEPFEWFLVPPLFAGRRSVFIVHVMVERARLPNGALKQPFIRCLLFRNRPHTKVLMIDYRAGDESIRVPDDLPAAPIDTSTPEPLPCEADIRSEMALAAQQMYAENYSRKYVRKKLLEAKYPEGQVDAVVEEAWSEYIAEVRRKGTVQACLGTILLAVGAIITLVSIKYADENGGIYVVMIGLFLTGAWNLFRGTVRAIGGR